MNSGRTLKPEVVLDYIIHSIDLIGDVDLAVEWTMNDFKLSQFNLRMKCKRAIEKTDKYPDDISYYIGMCLPVLPDPERCQNYPSVEARKKSHVRGFNLISG